MIDNFNYIHLNSKSLVFPHYNSKNFIMKKRIGLTDITHLKNRLPWTMGVAGIIRMMVWETDNALGISKTRFYKKIIDATYENLTQQNQAKDEIERKIKQTMKDEISSSTAETIYDEPIKGVLISPIEAQRRVRYFSEEFLNKEFDIFLSLLPDEILTAYFSKFFSMPDECQWSIIGSSNDFEQSTGMSFMYMDTLAYCHNSSTLVALELKMDSKLGDDQLLKYKFMAAYLESKGMIAQNTNLKILVLSPDPEGSSELPVHLEKASRQLEDEGNYPKKRISLEETRSLVPRVRSLMENSNVEHTTWQEFGEYFEKLLVKTPDEGYSQTLHKLIDGFLSTLETKFSRKLQKRIYTRTLQ